MSFFQIVPYKIAKQRGMKFYFTGSRCVRGSVWVRRVSTKNCVCPRCILVKNSGNNRHYHSIKNDPEFKAKVRKNTKNKKEWKREYDRRYRERAREKRNEWSRNWAKRNPEKRRSISLNYKAKRREIEDSGMTGAELNEWKKRQSKVCYWCGVACKSNYHVDHYTPLSKGGAHQVENLVIACPRCNLTKNCTDPYEFAQRVGRLF